MNKFVTLKVWFEHNYLEEYKPQRVRAWVKKGLIYPKPVLHGREYMVCLNASYIHKTPITKSLCTQEIMKQLNNDFANIRKRIN
ncbi:excisionase [Pseudoalteromonas sp. SSM20]|uniref:excisionase n=1 Tax=Pseudoalteromonas sp. SSM20 TaxID=3139394 RepID=UPI003BAC582B